MSNQDKNCCSVSRRHFLHDCGYGLGKIALAGLLTGGARSSGRSRGPGRESAGPEEAALSPQGQGGDPSLHGRGPKPTGNVRQQAGTGKAGRQAVAALGDRRAALCVHPTRRGRAWPEVQVRPARFQRGRAFGDGAAPGQGGRRSVHCPQREYRPVQSRPRADFLQHRLLAARPALHRLLGAVWTGGRNEGTAGLRRDEHRDGHQRRGGQLVQRLPAHDLRRRAIAQRRLRRSSTWPVRRAATPRSSGRRSNWSRSSIGSGSTRIGDPEIATRISSYEMALRLQTSAPELTNLRSESKATLGSLRLRSRQAVVRPGVSPGAADGRAGRAVREHL